MKLCSECKTNKSYDYFHKDAKNKDGYKGKCIECRRGQYQHYMKDKAAYLHKLYQNIKARCTSHHPKHEAYGGREFLSEGDYHD